MASRVHDDDAIVEVNLESDEEQELDDVRKPEPPSIDLEFNPEARCLCASRVLVMRILLSIFSTITLVFGCGLIFVVEHTQRIIGDAFPTLAGAIATTTVPGSTTTDMTGGTQSGGSTTGGTTGSTTDHIAAPGLSVTTLIMSASDAGDGLAGVLQAPFFAGMFVVVLALVGFWSAGTRRKNVIIFYLCYLIVSFTLLVYCIIYTVEFGFRMDTLSDAYNIEGKIDGALDYVKVAGLLFGLSLVLVTVKFIISFVLLGCTSAIAALVMVFNMATGVVGFMFIALAAFAWVDNVGAEWALIFLIVGGVSATSISLLGFRVAEMVLAQARRLREKAVLGERAYAPEGDAIGKKNVCCFQCCCLASQVWASVYLVAMAVTVIALMINAGVCFVEYDKVKELLTTDGFSMSGYFFHIATGSILLMIMIFFNFAAALYLFYLAFETVPKTQLRAMEMASLLRRQRGAQDGVATTTTIDAEDAEKLDAMPPTPIASPRQPAPDATAIDLKFVGEILELLEENKHEAAASRAQLSQIHFERDERGHLADYAAAVADAIEACYSVEKSGDVAPVYRDLEQLLDVLSRHHMTNPRSMAALNLRCKELDSIGAKPQKEFIP